MLSPLAVLLYISAYMLLLFGIAIYVERKAVKGTNLANNPVVYSLSLAIYCTGWTFYGSVGSAANSGLLFTTVYVGPTVSIMLYWILLRKLVVLKNNHRITSIADFISTRYGKSQAIAALVSLFLFIGIAPYIALQLKAISSTMDIVTESASFVSPESIKSNAGLTTKENGAGTGLKSTGKETDSGRAGMTKKEADSGRGGSATGLAAMAKQEADSPGAPSSAAVAVKNYGKGALHDWIIVILLILFTILFGVRKLDPTERHQGIVMVVAIESIVKIIAFVSVGIFVTFYVFGGFTDIFTRFGELSLHDPSKAIKVPGTYEWMTYLFLSMSAILFLPRQFHVSVIENFKIKHILTAMWLFPLYMLLINIFAYPIALAGLVHGIPKNLADNFVLLFPKLFQMPWLTMFVFIGGCSASTSMVIVESMALSTMVVNHIVLPVIVRTKRLAVLKRHLLYFRWLFVALSILTGYYLSIVLSDKYIFVAIGMLSFAAVIQLVPSIVGGLFWPQGNKMGALLGLCSGYLLWFYTLLLPALEKSNLISRYILDNGLFGLGYLKPEQLFGLTGVDSLTNGVFWSMLFNVSLYIGGSIYFKQTEEEKGIAEKFIDVLDDSSSHFKSLQKDYTIELPVKIDAIKSILSDYFGRQKANEIVQNCIKELELQNKTYISLAELLELSNLVEKILSGSTGASSASYIIQHSGIFTPEEKKQCSNIYSDIIAELKLSPSDLRKKIDYHKDKEAIQARHTKELEAKVQDRTAELLKSVEELAQKDVQLNATLDYVNAVIDNMADGLLVVNADGAIVRINEPLARIFHIDAADTSKKEKSVEEVFGQELSRLVKHCRLKGAAAGDIELPSGHVLKVSATVIHMQKQSHANVHASGHIEALNEALNEALEENSIVAIVRDVTKEREIDRMKTDFISTVSHELRTPLTSILGFAEIIKDRLETHIFPNVSQDSPKTPRSVKLVRDNMNIILQEGTRLTSLINDVLDIAKMEAGRVDWKNEQVSVAELIDRALQATSSLFTAKGIDAVKEVEDDLPLISGDSDRLLQVVINLISNAVKFTGGGSVICQAKKCTTGLMVSVIDTGKGIDTRDHDKVFEKFRQIGDTLVGKPLGTGLGLPISKQIVEHHGGQLWVESSPGRGSKFSFNIPVNSGEALGEALDEAHTDETIIRQSRIFNNLPKMGATDVETLISRIKERVSDVEYCGDGKVKTILAVDDDDSIRELLRQELEGQGYYVKTARDGVEALDSIRKQKPDLIILDVMMPGMSGFDVAAVLKGDTATADIPVIILSIIEDLKRGNRLGVDRYFTKPIDMVGLFTEIRELLAKGGTNKKVLVIDENEANVKTLSKVLQAKGYSVTAASGGLESIEKARALKPDMIIIDSVFSELDRVVKTLRFEKGLENAYFIYLHGPDKDVDNSRGVLHDKISL